ncbi:MAG: ABC transporter substrate-binding protein, partial [Alphaproteobacteria bacterium]
MTPISARKAFLSCAIALVLFAGAANAAERRHGLSTFGNLKYAADFTHFDYVNPQAPKGGRLSMIGTAGLITFNSLNGFILKGDAAQGLGYLFDSLMTPAQDEPDSMYGLVAKSVELADDRRSVTFYLRGEARFADGSPLRAQDVVNAFTLLKEKGHPRIALQLRDVEKVEALDASTVRYHFTGNQIRDLPA